MRRPLCRLPRQRVAAPASAAAPMRTPPHPTSAAPGDTLFSLGCGRLFEGTPAQMLESLDRLAALPDSTRVYCAHEYTLSNLAFAMAADPDNGALAARLAACEALRAQGRPTVPSTIAEERATNPFLRADQPALRAAAERFRPGAAVSVVSVFAALREWKNGFR